MEGNILHFYYGGVRLLMHVVGCGSSKMVGLPAGNLPNTGTQ